MFTTIFDLGLPPTLYKRIRLERTIDVMADLHEARHLLVNDTGVWWSDLRRFDSEYTEVVAYVHGVRDWIGLDDPRVYNWLNRWITVV